MSQSVTSAANTGSASDRLQALDLALPELRDNPYYVHHRTVGSSIYISGQLPFKDGWLLGRGVVGRDVELETARELARHAALNCLAAAVQQSGRDPDGLHRCLGRPDVGVPQVRDIAGRARSASRGQHPCPSIIPGRTTRRAA
ncbi:hypothetical protein [Streptomyces bicolor]|uniref:hypothetical protein n=1 Tax=Streptomyces bicolor TaxID=66874 RepID=UPI001FD48EC7|nr:hypothetical protein [Streptomyces bicolor]